MISLVVGARPNLVKVAPVLRELRRREVQHRLIHTGQHWGSMSDPFLAELEIQKPDVFLKARGGHAEIVATTMVGVEADLVANRPDWLVVFGDVDSTLGAALAAVKIGVRVAHVESGYRSHDWTMPEEVNRVLVDRMSDLLLCPDNHALATAFDNPRGDMLRRPGSRVSCVGNVMMDSLRWALARTDPKFLSSPRQETYAVLTVHRPANVDDGPSDRLRRAVQECDLPIVWPVHPRTNGGWVLGPNVTRIDPLGYLDMVALLRDASLVITDSGGLYEEALYLDKKIISLRDPLKNERSHLTSVPEIWRTDAAPRIVVALLGG